MDTLLVDSRGVAEITGSRVYGPSGTGAALKVSAASALVRKRSLLQGGIVVTAPQRALARQRAAALASQLDTVDARARAHLLLQPGEGPLELGEVAGSAAAGESGEEEHASSSVEIKSSEIR